MVQKLLHFLQIMHSMHFFLKTDTCYLLLIMPKIFIGQSFNSKICKCLVFKITHFRISLILSLFLRCLYFTERHCIYLTNVTIQCPNFFGLWSLLCHTECICYKILILVRHITQKHTTKIVPISACLAPKNLKAVFSVVCLTGDYRTLVYFPIFDGHFLL